MKRELWHNLKYRLFSVGCICLLIIWICGMAQKQLLKERENISRHNYPENQFGLVKMTDIVGKLSLINTIEDREERTETVTPAEESGLSEEESKKGEKEEFTHAQVEISRIAGGWRLKLYDANKQEIFAQNYSGKPGVSPLENSELLEIKDNEDNSSGYVFYFNPQNSSWTEAFFNPVFFKAEEKDCIAYMENAKTMRFKELWGEEKEGKIERDFTPYINPIIQLGQISEKNILLVYWEGDKPVEVTEILSITGETPIVEYAPVPYVLTPEIGEFFYGLDTSQEPWEWGELKEGENGPNYGFKDWHFIGCNGFCAVKIWETFYQATSELDSEDGRFNAGYVGGYQSRDKAWAEGAEGYGIGEKISMLQVCSYGWIPEEPYLEDIGAKEPYLVDGNLTYNQICIVNGYAKNKKVWEENGRVKRLLMLVEGQPFAYLELADTIKPQYFTLPEKSLVVPDEVFLECEFIIEEVYPGTKYEDTCLTGLAMDFLEKRSH